MEQKQLAIILLNWNGWKDTIECMESLLASTWQGFSIIVIDNDSDDDSKGQIKSWSKNRETFQQVKQADLTADKVDVNLNSCRITLIESSENLGFAKACNVGIRYAQKLGFQQVMLLNNDTTIKPDCLELLSNFSCNNPEFPVLTPLINYYDSPEHVWCFGGKLTFTGRRVFNYGNKQASKIKSEFKQVSFVSGCALWVEIRIFEKYGLLTEKFFFGQEDYHFSELMKRNKVKMAAISEAVVYHKVGSSNKKTFNSQDRIAYMFIGYLNRLIDKKYFCRSILIWRFWRVLNLAYIIPKLMLQKGYSGAKMFRFLKLLLQFSNERNGVSKELFFDSKKLFG